MPEICPRCGLIKELCTCGTIEREALKIKVYVTRRRFGKAVTIIEGIDEKSGKELTTNLKRKLACGGTFKNGNIELQGNHKYRIKDFLLKMGYDEDQIEIPFIPFVFIYIDSRFDQPGPAAGQAVGFA